ncbi:hypothetical protein PS2_018789 [Malus domestica]
MPVFVLVLLCSAYSRCQWTSLPSENSLGETIDKSNQWVHTKLSKSSARLPPLAFNPLLHGSASSACAALCSYACILLSTYACISLCSSWPKLEA